MKLYKKTNSKLKKHSKVLEINNYVTVQDEEFVEDD